MDELTYFDCSAQHHYSSYYLNALHHQAQRLGFRLRIRRRLARGPLRAAWNDARWRRLRFTCALFEARIGGRRRFFCIDGHDSNRLDAEGMRFGYHLPLLQASDLYFKVNHQPRFIEEDPMLAACAGRIVPIAQFVPLPLPPALLPRLRWWPTGWDRVRRRDWLRNLRDLRHPPPPLSTLRDAGCRDIDVFYVTSHWQGDRHAGAAQHRNAVVEALTDALVSVPGTRTSIGFASDSPLPREAERFRVPRLSAADYARTVARSRIFVYTRGLHDCLSSKLYCAIAGGATVVGDTLANRPDWLANYPHLRRQFGFDSADDVAHRVRELLGSPDEVADLARENLRFFEQQLSPSATAEHVLTTLRSRVADQP